VGWGLLLGWGLARWTGNVATASSVSPEQRHSWLGICNIRVVSIENEKVIARWGIERILTDSRVTT
jgi:hypothetical protein